MSTIRLDIPTAHNDDISEPMEGQFGNIYHTWDMEAARKRRSDDTQCIIAANKLSDEENKEGQ